MAAFAISMIVGLFTDALFVSCLSSMWIAIGFVPFMIALYTINRSKSMQAAGMAGIGFAIVYAVLALLVYYAECTAVRESIS